MPSKFEQRFEKSLWGFRFIILVAVFSLMISSLAAFYLGVHSNIEAFNEITHYLKQGGELKSNVVIVYLIASIDEFLLGIIMIIIALGIYELFISKIDFMDDKDSLPFPKWLTFQSLDELKGVLTKVIIIILMVYFFKKVVMMEFDTPLSILYLAIGIILIAIANYISHKPTFGSKGKH